MVTPYSIISLASELKIFFMQQTQMPDHHKNFLLLQCWQNAWPTSDSNQNYLTEIFIIHISYCIRCLTTVSVWLLSHCLAHTEIFYISTLKDWWLKIILHWREKHYDALTPVKNKCDSKVCTQNQNVSNNEITEGGLSNPESWYPWNAPTQ